MSEADALIARAIAPWELVRVSLSPTTLLIECRDELARVHLLECGLRDTTSALFVGERVQLGYRSQLAPAPVDRYRVIFERLIEGESLLLDTIAKGRRRSESEPTPRPKGPTIYVTEYGLARRFAAGRLRSKSAREIVAELFAEWFPRAEGELHLYLESRCRQHCEFCEEAANRDRPLRRTLTLLNETLARAGVDLVDSGAFEAILEHAARSGTPVMLTGHDWLQHPRLHEILSSLERHASVQKTLAGPSTELAGGALFERVASLPGLRAVRTTLQSIDESEHDAMVGRVGAARDVLTAIERFAERGVRVDLTTVITRRALPSLARTVRFIADRGLSVTLHAFVPDQGMNTAGTVLAPVDELRDALHSVDAGVAIAAVVGVPVCALTPELASRLEPAWRTPERQEMVFAETCRACVSRDACSGVPAPYLRTFGSRGLSPENAAAASGRKSPLHTS